MRVPVTRHDGFGLVRSALDAHTLGLSTVAQTLQDCGYRAVIAEADVCQAFADPSIERHAAAIEAWIREHGITVLGFSYRLDPRAGADLVGRLIGVLQRRQLLADRGGPLKALYFAGLPETCERVRRQHSEVAGVFCGAETPGETLRGLGVPADSLPRELSANVAYDEGRLAFGRELVQRGDYLAVRPAERSGYQEYGGTADSLVARLRHRAEKGNLPLFRAHVGPYLPDRLEAVRLFQQWARQLAAAGFLDILSIGTSQLTQSDFGTDWQGKPNGGGVPFNSLEEFAAAWEAARPMLVRTYAGTRNVPQLARMYERTIHIAWHALSLWWFCQIDGRGPYSVQQNLRQHVETLQYIAATGKPFEANVPHHFAFRGGDDASYLVSAYLAAKLAKTAGIRHFILQNMLNTPRGTWGIADLAKSRAMLRLVRQLEDARFRVILQPRAGLDYFSHDLNLAKAQLAAATALMDDIEPHDAASPPMIHVVSYSEASHLADPAVVSESIQITRQALLDYRRLRTRGLVDDLARHPDVVDRTNALLAESRTIIEAIEATVPQPYTPEGLYQVLAWGFLPVPFLTACRDEFAQAIRWKTRLIRGSVVVVDDDGLPIPAAQRLRTTGVARDGRLPHG
ncbi:MAG TPA: hypothetical protein PLF81_02965 [Candidatus Anammoximicrobium sp.]|nr:hypothetical protein [Candidatus Anammoximicrobium sp.]